MTIIVVKDGVMAADSGESQGNIMRRLVGSKIIRNNAGWIAGVSGNVSDITVFNSWFAAGMPKKGKPEKLSCFRALLLDASGCLWRIDEDLSMYRVASPAVCGEESSEAFTLGAMLAGATAEQAVKLACEYCIWVAAPVHVECV